MYRRAVAWNLSVSYYKKQNTHFIYAAALKLIISKNRGGSRIFLRRGCTSKEWRHWRWGNKILKASTYIYTKKAFSQGGVRTPCTLPLDPPLKNQSNCEINLTCDMDIPDYNETPRLPRYVRKCNTFSANLTGKLLVPLRCGWKRGNYQRNRGISSVNNSSYYIFKI